MKVFVAFCSLLALASAELLLKSQENLLQFQEECKAELELPESLYDQYKKLQYPDDALTPCYLKCLLSKFDLFDNDKGFNAENVHKQLLGDLAEATHDDELHNKVEACADNNEQGSNACEWAFRGVNCLWKNNLQLFKESEAPAPDSASDSA